MADISSKVFLGHKLLLVGRTGNGKSSTGNSILDKKEFSSRSSTSPISYDIKLGRGTIGEVPLEVVDGPGLGDTDTDLTDDGHSMNGLVAEALALISNQFDALLLVLKYGVRLTNQEKRSVRVIKMVFGEDVLNRFGVIVMTHGDQFDKDIEEDGGTFASWCDRQEGDARSLFDECDRRCVLFDNRTKDDGKKQKQVELLLKIVVGMKQNRSPYGEEDFRRAQLGRDKLVVMGKMSGLTSRTEDVVTKITRCLDEIGQRNQTDRIDELQKTFHEIQKLSEELQDHKKSVQTEDAGTKLVDHLLLKIFLTESRIRTLTDMQSRRLESAEFQTKLANEVRMLDKRHEDLRKTHDQSSSIMETCLWLNFLIVPVIAAYVKETWFVYSL